MLKTSFDGLKQSNYIQFYYRDNYNNNFNLNIEMILVTFFDIVSIQISVRIQ
ncbi:hypothetical protein pb186bvf_000137 [Paramecium bursaria]